MPSSNELKMEFNLRHSFVTQTINSWWSMLFLLLTRFDFVDESMKIEGIKKKERRIVYLMVTIQSLYSLQFTDYGLNANNILSIIIDQIDCHFCKLIDCGSIYNELKISFFIFFCHFASLASLNDLSIICLNIYMYIFFVFTCARCYYCVRVALERKYMYINIGVVKCKRKYKKGGGDSEINLHILHVSLRNI